MGLFRLRNGILGLLLMAVKGAMATTPLTNYPVHAVSPWEIELGTRYWFSTGRYRYNLFDDVLISRLTFKHLTGHSGEGFWRANHESGLFLKGNLGGGSITSGTFIDDDFPPVTVPFSSTVSQQKRGLLGYLTADAGYDLLCCKNFDFGGFIGYSYWKEHYNAFGLKQTATLPTIPQSTVENLLDEEVNIHSLRLGVNSNLALTRRLSLSADAAYIHSYFIGHDFHNLRPDIRNFLNDGIGNGVQLEGTVNWTVSPGFAVGIGGRWWHVFTKGYAHFEEVFSTGDAQHTNLWFDRYGLLVQANYVFGNGCISPCIVDTPSFCWSGLYVGAQVGYGTIFNNVAINATSGVTQVLEAVVPTPNQLHIQNSGFLGGGQIGYNWQKCRCVAGLEADFDYSGISGSNGVTTSAVSGSANIITTATARIKWLATLRGRVGILGSNKLLAYLTAGPALGRSKLDFDQRFFIDPSIYLTQAFHTTTKIGWSAGAGFEYAVNRCFSFKTEYLYVDVGKLSTKASGNSLLGGDTGFATYQVNFKMTSHTIRLGLNYKL
jgi:opacity protein-like surface antigen